MWGQLCPFVWEDLRHPPSQTGLGGSEDDRLAPGSWVDFCPCSLMEAGLLLGTGLRGDAVQGQAGHKPRLHHLPGGGLWGKSPDLVVPQFPCL